MGLFYKNVQVSNQEDIDPDQVLTGTCRTCKYHVEIPYYQAIKPIKRGFDGPSRMENDCYSTECPNCGARAYLSAPDYHRVPKIYEPIKINERGNNG